ERLQLSHLLGSTSERGGFVAAYDFAHDEPLDLADTGLIQNPSRSGTRLFNSDLQPTLDRHSLFASGQYAIRARVDLYADAMYTYNDNRRGYSASYDLGYTYDARSGTRNNAYSVAVGARTNLSSAWKLDISAARSVSNADDRSQTAYTEDAG